MIITILLSQLLVTWATPPPAAPTESAHPGSKIYDYELFHETFTHQGRKVDFFAPKNLPQAPMIVFGHGQALDVDTYRDTLVHLARKGVAVAFPMYDTGFFDTDWSRMAKDFVRLSQATIDRYPDQIDPGKVVFAGHSKGGYVGLMAAGVPAQDQTVRPAAVVVFAPAGYDQQHLDRMDKSIPLSIIWGEEDTTVKGADVDKVFRQASVDFKQFITVKSYPTSPKVAADHMFVLNSSTFFGGPQGTTALHYYGVWKWLLGAVWDLHEPQRGTNEYLYGEEALATGLSGHRHGRRVD